MNMKSLRMLVALGALGLALGLNAYAQDTTPRPTPTDPPRIDPPPRPEITPVPPERPGLPPRGEVLRPDRPNRPGLPPEIAALMREFETDREAFLAKQREVLKTLQGATEEQRATIRETLRQNREQWLKDNAELREQIRQKLQELKDKLPNRREVLDNAGPRPGTRPGVN